MARSRYLVDRKGFTLVEILFALALIALLVSMLFLGAGALLSGGKEKATKVTLAALKGMLAEYDSKTKLNKAPKFWLVYNRTTGKAEVVNNALGNQVTYLWQGPPPPASPAPFPNERDALDAPGSVAAGTYSENPALITVDEIARNASRQVINTQLVMSLLLQMPANRAALTKLPPESYSVPKWVGGNRLPAPGGDGALYFGSDVADNVIYPQGAKVQTSAGGFLCVNTSLGYALGGSTVPAPGPDWQPDRSPVTPVVLDSWGNPIIFVPGSGLRVRLLNGKDKLDTADDKQTAIVISPEGKIDLTTTPGTPRVIQVGRPFFASAGPDGDFAKGDDNVYSFDQ